MAPPPPSPPHLAVLTSLKTADFSRNRLTHTGEDLAKCTSLTVLRLQDNFLTRPPDCVSEMGSLVILDLLGNPLAAGVFVCDMPVARPGLCACVCVLARACVLCACGIRRQGFVYRERCAKASFDVHLLSPSISLPHTPECRAACAHGTQPLVALPADAVLNACADSELSQWLEDRQGPQLQTMMSIGGLHGPQRKHPVLRALAASVGGHDDGDAGAKGGRCERGRGREGGRKRERVWKCRRTISMRASP